VHGHLSQRRPEAALEAAKLLREEEELRYLLVDVLAILGLLIAACSLPRSIGSG